MCHSFLGALGVIEGGAETVVQTMVEAVSPSGNVVFPTFTYSYFKNEVFDWNKSPSGVGLLGEVARKFPGAVRSLDPVFSMVCIGPSATALMSRSAVNSFGEGSTYDKLHKAGLNILLLGVDFTAMSLFMHFERLWGVPYRYNKQFRGVTRKDGELFEDSVIHYVRDMKFACVNDRTEIGKILEADSRCRSAQLGYRNHLKMSSAAIAEVVQNQLATDIYSLVRRH
jgi:aminoglycoside 3-N-acetyltransferase